MEDLIDIDKLKDEKIFITSHIPGIGGQIKQSPEDFYVEEIPQYSHDDNGHHLFLWIEKRQITTFGVAKFLQEFYELEEVDVGFSGIKDKEAVAYQMFSMSLQNKDEIIDPKTIDHPNFRVLDYYWHSNKLRRGHLYGNRFKIIIRDAQSGMMENIKQKVDYILSNGLPNYYDNQRFKEELSPTYIQQVIMKPRRMKNYHKHLQLKLSSIQAAIFNGYLSKRITNNYFFDLLDGDVVKKEDSGGLFIGEKNEENIARFQKNAISITGPIIGKKMMEPLNESREFEADYLKSIFTHYPELGFIKSDGSRRVLRVFPKMIDFKELEKPGDYFFEFILPKGSYATHFMAEIRH